MDTLITHIGRPTRRVDGQLKVTGRAKYAAEYDAPGLLHGAIVSSSIPAGRIVRIHTDKAKAFPGVVEIFTHENRGKAAWLDYKWRDQVAPPGHPFRPLHSDRVVFDGQPIALVVAESYEAARDAATLVHADYQPDEHRTDLLVERERSYQPPKKRSGVPKPPSPRGDAEGAFDQAPVKLANTYRIAAEHHNPMELFATTCVRGGDGKLTLYEKTQGSQNSQSYVTSVFGLKSDDVEVINHYVGGAFGSGLRPQHQLFFAVMASLELERSVRVSLTRDQMFHIGYRPEILQTVGLACDAEGRLQAVMHDATAGTSHFEDYQENVVNWSGLLYRCDNVRLSYELAKLNTYTPCDMRAPGAASGVTALECAMDELAYAARIDPLELRRINFATRDENDNKELTSKALDACYDEGAAAFGWDKRSFEPRSMRDGRDLIGWGMATGVWEASMQKTVATAKLSANGHLEIATASSDIGTGTWTILTQIGADALGLPLEAVTARIGESGLPASPIEGGSWTAASAGSAVQAACDEVRKSLLKQAAGLPGSPLADASPEDVRLNAGRLELKADPSRGISIGEIMTASGIGEIEEEGKAAPDKLQMLKYVSYTHSAIFAEVAVDEELGVIRVTRVVCATAAGRILNPKTARSQILGGVVMGIGMALHEEAMTDHHLGRVMNHNIAEYHMPVNADIHDIEVIFVAEHDDKASPIGVKGLGEIGIVGTAAAVANAVFHATGKRIRDFPMTLDKVLQN
ncbi:dehydrogenase [Agaricicola taiwanensis]|uniref:Dehydrogenase n=1 Tax=Agaricicola taiwanensis TaxID=591372 RepID=A0A8J2YKQ0_9RHOB|nr:xanthine dehydrogenase family protein molybdopterin-binding subunit [Agaricicola taiwanensis]GGE49024.1 dehydrogenase [Agaricicola taiwanensis]